jgi:hypothetical protein
VSLPSTLGFVGHPAIKLGLCAEPLLGDAAGERRADAKIGQCVAKMRHHASPYGTTRHWGAVPISLSSCVQAFVCSITTWNSSGFLRLLGLLGFPIDIALLGESGSRDWLRFAKNSGAAH